jgi:hypothetical protein
MRRRNIVAAALAALLSAGLPAIGAPVATVSGATATYYLPAPAGTKLVVTQSQNTAGDHDAAHDSQDALDFGIAGNAEFDVTASRAGKVIGLRDNSSAHCYKTTTGAIDLSCWKDANYVLVDHHDGTSALYVHLATGKAVVKIGDDVVAGQKLAVDDNTGFSSKNHLHFMVETTPTVPNTPAPGPTDKTAVAWWWTNSQPVSFSDPDVLAKAPDGIPTYGMTVTSGAPTPTTAPAVSGTWVAPKDGAKLATSTLTLSAKPTVTPATLSVTKVAFSVAWGSTTKTACSTAKAGSGGVWSCNVDLWKSGAPLGKLTLSFDVTDSAGDVAKAPAGTQTVTLPATASVTLNVALVSCPTLYGTGERAKPIPATETLTLPVGVAAQVAVYATNYTRLLGPRGWSCSGTIGVDGSGGMSLSSRADPSSQIVLGTSGVNQSSADWMACAYFAAARSAEAALGIVCPDPKPPSSEVVTSRSARFVFLADPARVKGSLPGSGGRYRIIGGTWYSGGQSATDVGCALPGGSSLLCTAIIADWQHRAGR